MASSSICERLRPIDMESFVGNDLAKKRVQQWIKGGRRGPLVLSGGSGVGKTSLAMIALEGRSIVTLDPSSTRVDAAELLRLARQSLRMPLDGSGALALLVDDFQACAGVRGADLLGVATKVPRCPLVVTCRESTDASIKKMIATGGGIDVRLAPPTRQDTQQVLVRVCKAIRGILTPEKVRHIHDLSNGDLRRASLQAEMEATYPASAGRAHHGEASVTCAADAPIMGAAEREAVVACRLLGLPLRSCPYAATEATYRGLDASAVVASDPVRSAGVVHDLGLEALLRRQGRGVATTEALSGWSDVCDDLALADVLERRGGAGQGHELVARTVATRCRLGEGGVRLDMRQVTRPPALFLKGGASAPLRACALALHPVTSTDSWTHPLRALLRAQPHRLAEIARHHRLPHHHVLAVAKAYGIEAPTEAAPPAIQGDGKKRKRRGKS